MTGRSLLQRLYDYAEARRLAALMAARAEGRVCGAWMPYARAGCARRPGHTTEHRSAYAMENAARRWSA